MLKTLMLEYSLFQMRRFDESVTIENNGILFWNVVCFCLHSKALAFYNVVTVIERRSGYEKACVHGSDSCWKAC
jgi:hypothetical protein